MRRLFLSLYAALAIAFLICVLGVPMLINTSLRSPAERYGERLAVAPQYLFEQELRNVPQEQWPKHIRELQSYFGYELSLLTLDEIQTDELQLQQLRNGIPITPTDKDKTSEITLDVMLLPIRGSEYVVRTTFAESVEDKDHHSLSGIFHLIEKNLTAVSPEQRSAGLQQFSQQFGMPLQLLDQTQAQAELTPTQLQSLNKHKVIGVDMDSSGGERYFKLLSDNTSVLKIGPLPVPVALLFATPIAYASFASILAIITFLWIRPLWRDMRRLDQCASDFGSGNLAARVKVADGSSIRILTNTFNSMANQIQALITNQRELTHAVSHELRTPLARLRFALDMLTNSATEADRSRYVAGMHTDIRELEDLIDESLSYARLTSPHAQPVRIEPVVVSEWLDNVLAANRHLAKSISVTTELSLGPATTEFDGRLLGRALQNIVRNALQYAKARVHISLTTRNDHLELFVDDDGPGIAVDQRESIFMAFHRVDSSRNRETGGYGLGLAIVKRICDLHHATVTAEDSPLGGARFRVVLSTKTLVA